MVNTDLLARAKQPFCTSEIQICSHGEDSEHAYCNSDNWEATVSSSTENLDEAHKQWIIGPASLEQSSPFALLKWNSAVQAAFLILLQLCH